MKPVGRKLVFDFEKHIIALEIYPKTGGQPYEVPDKSALLFDLVTIEGEKIEKFIGEPFKFYYGRELSRLCPAESPEAWVTKEEWECQKETKTGFWKEED